MANREDEFYDDSLGNDRKGDGIGEDGDVEEIEPLEEGASAQASPADGYVFGHVESAVEAVPATLEMPTALSAEDEQFLNEIDDAQNKSKGVGALILTLLISGVLFVVAGMAWWSWQFTLTLVPILLIHELGHFVTMKSFKYRNVNMFFIPFLGAAVTGQQFNVPAWKKAVVALMGPLPSIVLATGIGIAAIALHLDWLVYACIASLFLNGLNLVPLLPFDGGHVLHAVLYCRHYYLDVALRIATAAVAFGFAMVFGGSAVVIGIAVFPLMTIPMTMRIGEIARRLRSERGLGAIIEDDRVAPTTALVIAASLRERIKAKMTTKTLAQLTLQVVEQINTRPPGWLASFGLLFVHVAGLGVALLAGIGLSIAVNDDFRKEFMVGLQPPPLYAYDSDAIEVRGDQYVPTYSTKSVIATFATPAEANAAFDAATPEISSQSHLQRFGQSVSIALHGDATPKTLQSWIDRWEPQAQELLVQASYVQVFFSLDATFPDWAFALRVENELRAYLENGYRYTLNPPWQPDALVGNPAESEQYKARTSLLAVMKLTQKAVDEDERTAAAERIGDFDEVKRISDEIRRETIAKFKASNPDIDTITVDLYLKVSTGEYDKEAQRQLTERLGGTFVDYDETDEGFEDGAAVDEDVEGSATVDDGAAGDRKIEDSDDVTKDDASGDDDIDDDYAPYELTQNHERFGGVGSVVRSVKTVSLRTVRLNVTAEGAKAIADWLRGLGAYDITYAFYTYDE